MEISMKILQIEKFFRPLKDKPCHQTDRLIMGGYQQKSGGYIKCARCKQMIVDYKRAMPKQSWHLLESYCANSKKNENFTRRIQCGELIFWMAEVSKAVSEPVLIKLADEVLLQPSNRRRGNKLIQNICFDAIIETVNKQKDNI